MTSSILSSGFTGVTGGVYAGSAGRLLPMPGSGDGVTLWVGGGLQVPGVPPGTQAQLIDWQKTIYAEAIFGLNCQAQFFRPPNCDFPIGRIFGLTLMISYHGITGPVQFSSRPLPLPAQGGAFHAFPLYINSQNWSPPQYGPATNNVLYTTGPFKPDGLMHTRE
jgi:hypothetical protein